MSILFSRPAPGLGAIEEIASGRHWDGAKLENEIARRAAALAEKGIGTLATLAIAHGSSADFFADLLAVWRLGATAACLDPALTAPELQRLVAFIAPAAVLVSAKPLSCGSSAPLMNLTETGDLGSTDLALVPQPGFPDAAAPALVLFTSGTTGDPKGVVLSYGALAARISENIAAIGATALARSLVTLPTSFGHGLIGNALTPLLAGGCIVLGPSGFQLARDLGRIIDAQRISFMSSVPALWRMAFKLGRPPTGDSLTRIHVGSAPLSAELWSEIATWARCEVVNCYGITETANWVGGARASEGIAQGLVGKPWGGEAAICDESGIIRASGEGEIVLRSPALMSGYLARPDLSASAIRNGWYHTGDRGRVDQSGRIWLAGRIKEEINRAGFKVQPAEIDRLLEQHPAVAEACAFAQPDPVAGETVGVAVCLLPGASETAESLRAWCRARIRREAVPEHWHFLHEIPRNARGKLNRDAVQRLIAEDPQ